MSDRPLSWKRQIAEKLRNMKESLATEVVQQFYKKHPDWDQRYGEAGRRHSFADCVCHVGFLAGAVDADLPQAFADYLTWVEHVLTARGIKRSFLDEVLVLMRLALVSRLWLPEQMHVVQFLQVEYPPAARDVPRDAPVTTELNLVRNLFLQALLQGDRRAALTIASEAAREPNSVADIYIEVLQKSLYEIGSLWESNRITVAQEHMATAIVQFVLAHLYTLIPAVGESKGNAVVTGVQGELHQVGAHMVADVLEAGGWNVRFLGVNVPHHHILQVIGEHKPSVVGVSATMVARIPDVRHLITDVRSNFANACPRIVVGGSAFRHEPALAKAVEADGCGTDLRSAGDAFQHAMAAS